MDLLRQMEAERELCLENPPFLALLGALWLEQGNPTQALIWLERALLINPRALGAQLDHALALAALGEPAAAQRLLLDWQGRKDVPPGVLARLREALTEHRQPVGPAQAMAVAGRPASVAEPWQWRTELSWAGGHESNLDLSPRLTEVRLTGPEGPVVLPLVLPLEPRAGQARTVEASFQGQHSNVNDVLWQFGLLGSLRRSPDAPETDHQATQVALARWHQAGGLHIDALGRFGAFLRNPWRIQNQLSWASVGGRLSDPFAQFRYGLLAESDWGGACVRRAELELGRRWQRHQSISDGMTQAFGLGLECRQANGGFLSWGLRSRFGWDRAVSDLRPGGNQLQTSLAGSLGIAWTGGLELDLGLKWSQLLDREGYSPLLESNSRRKQRQWVGTVDLNYRLPAAWGKGIELWAQGHILNQSSNIKLFEHNVRAAYAGLRWRL